MRQLADAAPLLELAEDEGLVIHPLPLDVTDDASVRSAVEHVLDRSGKVDALINNAAVVQFTPIEHTEPTALAAVLDTDVIGCVRTARAVLPAMRARRRGAIVNVSSIAGRIAPFCTGPYVMAKWALEAASEALAQEVAPHGIRVAVLEPEFHTTRMIDDATRLLGLDPESPYADAERRIAAWFAASKQTAGDPLRVAQAVHEAISTETPQFRYPVGPAAEVYIHGRDRMSDEDWVAMGRPMSDEEFFAEFARRFPAPIPA
jgi:NAD(P)-dependent dehydrogenase (short-subunit alcohol dehydrogenase family)